MMLGLGREANSSRHDVLRDYGKHTAKRGFPSCHSRIPERGIILGALAIIFERADMP